MTTSSLQRATNKLQSLQQLKHRLRSSLHHMKIMYTQNSKLLGTTSAESVQNMQLHPLPTSSPSRRLRTVFLAWTHNKSETFATVVAAMSKARSISPLHLLLQQPSPGSLARKSASHPCHGRIDMADASDVH